MTDIISSLREMYEVASAYRYGDGGEDDKAKADEMFAKILSSLELLANSGDTKAMDQLGYGYLNGNELVKKDPGKARFWLEKRFAVLLKKAEAEDTDAMLQLAHAYRHGYGVDKDPEKAALLEKMAKDLRNG